MAQWLRCCATNRKVAGSIPAGVSGFFIDIKSFRSHYVPRVDPASNRNEYQEHFLGVKAAERRADNLTFMEPFGPVMGLLYLLHNLQVFLPFDTLKSEPQEAS